LSRKSFRPFSLAESEPEPAIKVWVTTPDDRARDSHQLANGQARFRDEPFLIGEAFLTEPRDPDGPPAETFNCRCRKEEYLLSRLPAQYLPQIEGRLSERQKRFLSPGTRLALRDEDASIGQDFAEFLFRTENKLSAGGVIHNLTQDEALHNFFAGDGRELMVSINQVAAGIDVVRDDQEHKLIDALRNLYQANNGKFGSKTVRSSISVVGMSVIVDGNLFGSVEFDFLGEIIGSDRGWDVSGKITAQSNDYDFNPGSHRPEDVERIVSIARFIGKVFGGVDYKIRFDGSKTIDIKGLWNEIIP